MEVASVKLLFRKLSLMKLPHHFINISRQLLLKPNNRDTRTKCEICSKLTIKTPERRHWRRSGVYIINFKHN